MATTVLSINSTLNWKRSADCMAPPSAARHHQAGSATPHLAGCNGWQDSHYHCFIAAEQQYFCENQLIQQGFDEWQEESTTCLQEVLTAARPELIYEYDFGDGWRHRILLEKTLALIGREPGEPQCLSGEHACPPESCGGPPGYEQLVAILKDPRHD